MRSKGRFRVNLGSDSLLDGKQLSYQNPAMRTPKGGDSTHEVTQLLQAWNGGNLEARDRALALVYQELRRKAVAHLRRERPGHVDRKAECEFADVRTGKRGRISQPT